jgi:tripeptidyl-peptidase-2
MAQSWAAGLLPKRETQSLQFIEAKPSYDGRGIIVGVLDTGCDPGAIGLSVTSEGLPKIIDVVDCAGSGDVIMGAPVSPEKAADGSATLKGVSGRTLKLNSAWSNPTGTYRLGCKRAFELYPRGLKDRVKEQRKKQWMESHRFEEARLQKELLTTTVPDDVEELKTRIAQLRLLEKDTDECGPLYDCLVFHDGQRWQAVVDCSESGDLTTVEPMCDYKHLRQFKRFSDLDALNFCVNVFDEGSVLSIVVDAGAHGTHVAGIIGAFHPDKPEENGVAPGVQIISLKIGDSRLGSMETGPGLLRGLVEAVKRGCHVINMSYGEASSWDNYGEFVRQAEIITRKHGVVFVSSAGNNGPALSTVGAPGGTSSACIGVAAYATQSLMAAAYALQTPLPETNYTWSSVGPTLDGYVIRIS